MCFATSSLDQKVSKLPFKTTILDIQWVRCGALEALRDCNFLAIFLSITKHNFNDQWIPLAELQVFLVVHCKQPSHLHGLVFKQWEIDRPHWCQLFGLIFILICVNLMNQGNELKADANWLVKFPKSIFRKNSDCLTSCDGNPVSVGISLLQATKPFTQFRTYSM